MANKELSKRQKLVIRVEPSQKALKARNPIAPGARQRILSAHHNSATSVPTLQQRLLKKVTGNSEDS